MPWRVGKKCKPSRIGNSNFNSTAHLTPRTKKQQRTFTMSFFAFPREIRDIIYSYVLSTEDTSSQALQPVTATEAKEIREIENEFAEANHAFGKLARHRSTSALSARTQDKKEGASDRLEFATMQLAELPRLIKTNSFRANKQMLAELSKYIRERVPVKVLVREHGKKSCTIRDLEELAVAQHIRIFYQMQHQHRRNTWPWSHGMELVLADREDIKTFHFEGTGIKILQDSSYEKRDDGCWVRVVGFPQYMAEWSCDHDLYRQIMNVLGNVPKVTASKGLKISWTGDERFPEDIEDDDIQEYRAQVAKLRTGLKA